jgi:hypothetical protein
VIAGRRVMGGRGVAVAAANLLLLAACSSGGGAASRTSLSTTGVVPTVSAPTSSSTPRAGSSSSSVVVKVPSNPSVTAVQPGVGARVRVRGAARVDGKPFTADFVGAVVRDDGLITPCQVTVPAVAQGRFEVGVYDYVQSVGCGRIGSEILLWTYVGDEKLFAQAPIMWPTTVLAGDSSIDADVSFSTAQPRGAAPATMTELFGRVYDRTGTELPEGSHVEAYIGPNLCGEASTRAGAFTGYVMTIIGAESRAGCDLGATVTFRVNGTDVARTRTNDNNVGEPPSTPPFDLALP